MKRKLSDWFRWRIAYTFNHLPDTCWVDLVLWAMLPEIHPFREIFDIRHTAGQCQREGARPYCGKCEEAR